LQETPIHNRTIITDIRAGKVSRERCIRTILNEPRYRRSIEKIVRERSGNVDDVTFVMNHTLVAFIKQVLQNKTLTIETNLYSYLNGIAKNIWLGELRKNKKISDREIALEYEMHDINSEKFLLEILKEERRQILDSILDVIGQKCKQVLSLWSADYSMKEIASLTDYKSEGVVRKKKFHCMKALSQYLDNNPHLKEMLK